MTEISLIVGRKHGKVRYMLLFLIDLVLVLQISLLNTRSLQVISFTVADFISWVEHHTTQPTRSETDDLLQKLK